MTHEEMEVLAKLRQACAQASDFALDFPDNGMPVDREVAFAKLLVSVAEAILHHANKRKQLVIEGEAVGPDAVIEGAVT